MAGDRPGDGDYVVEWPDVESRRSSPEGGPAPTLAWQDVPGAPHPVAADAARAQASAPPHVADEAPGAEGSAPPKLRIRVRDGGRSSDEADAEIAELKALVQELRGEIATLRHQLGDG